MTRPLDTKEVLKRDLLNTDEPNTKDINIQKERKQQNTKRKISMGLNGNLGILELEGDLIEFERDVNQTMVSAK